MYEFLFLESLPSSWEEAYIGASVGKKKYETSHWLFNKTDIAPEVICQESFLEGSL